MSLEAEQPWRIETDALLVNIRLTPRGGRDSIDGQGQLSDGRAVILARVRQVPEEGAANAALLKLLAKTAGVAPSAAEIIAGHHARLKTIRITGDISKIVEKLSVSLAQQGKREK